MEAVGYHCLKQKLPAAEAATGVDLTQPLMLDDMHALEDRFIKKRISVPMVAEEDIDEPDYCRRIGSALKCYVKAGQCALRLNLVVDEVPQIEGTCELERQPV